MGTNTNMECGCFNGSVGVIPTDIKGYMGIIPTQILGFVDVINTQIVGSVGIICTPNTEVILRFEQANLFWEKDENVVGFTKFNLLTASGNWSLEEIEIEELL